MGNNAQCAPPDDHRLSAEASRYEETFQALGNETRLEILSTMYLSHRREMSFTEIRDRISLDDHGNLVYHLDQLRPRFLEKGDGGYRLTTAAYFVLMLLLQGTFDPEPPTFDTHVDEACPFCRADLGIEYQHQFARLHCDACDRVFKSRVIPPGAAVGRTPEQVLAVLDTYTKSDIRHLVTGMCPYCHGGVECDVIPPEENPDRIRLYERDADDGVHVEFECSWCTGAFVVPAAGLLNLVPDAKTFLTSRFPGTDPIRFWELYALNTMASSTLTGNGRFTIQITHSAATLEVMFDTCGSPVEVKHRRRAPTA